MAYFNGYHDSSLLPGYPCCTELPSCFHFPLLGSADKRMTMDDGVIAVLPVYRFWCSMDSLVAPSSAGMTRPTAEFPPRANGPSPPSRR